MRCTCCNKILNNQESTRRFASGTFVDMCNKCLSTIEDSVDVVDTDVQDDYKEDNYE